MPPLFFVLLVEGIIAQEGEQQNEMMENFSVVQGNRLLS